MSLNLDSAVLYAHDITSTIPFYRDTLGLTLEYEQAGKFVSFIFPNGGRLGIKTAAEPREIPGHQTVFIGTGAIENDYEKLKALGLEFKAELTTQSWGQSFSLLDPDGNKVLFVQRT